MLKSLGKSPGGGWKDIFWRTYQEVSDDRLLAVAAGVVFYALLAVFPAISALVSMYGLFADAATISEHLSLLAGILPQGGLDIVQEQITRITSKGNATLGFGFILSLVVALWSANAGMKAIISSTWRRPGAVLRESFFMLISPRASPA